MAVASDRDNDVVEPQAVEWRVARHDLSEQVIKLLVTFMLFLSPHTLSSQSCTRRWLSLVVAHHPSSTPPQATCNASWGKLVNYHMVHR